MTLDDFYQQLQLPVATKQNQPITKKMLQEQVALSVAERKILTQQIQSLEIRYLLNPASCAIARYTDAVRDYGEIAILHIVLKTFITTTQLKRIGDLLQRAIPYPLMQVFVVEGNADVEDVESANNVQLAIRLADLRINQADTDKLVTEQVYCSEWFALAALSSLELAFVADLSLSQCNQQHLYALYADWLRSLTALEIARRTGHYARSASADLDLQRQERLHAIRQLELNLASTQATLKTESQFNRQLECNMQIKKLEKQIQQHIEQLMYTSANHY